jgi:hypothetical protein
MVKQPILVLLLALDLKQKPLLALQQLIVFAQPRLFSVIWMVITGAVVWVFGPTLMHLVHLTINVQFTTV